MAWHRSNETSKRLDAIPGVGPALATALVASVADPKAFRSGERHRLAGAMAVSYGTGRAMSARMTITVAGHDAIAE
jgi:transposase